MGVWGRDVILDQLSTKALDNLLLRLKGEITAK